MATYVPNATQTTEPTSSQTVESAALEFRTLKTSINSRIDALQVEVDAEEVTRAAADSALNVRTTALEQLAFNGSTPGTVVITKFVATASQTVFTLPVTPVTVATVDVYISGIYQNHDSFSLAGNVVTLSEGVIAGAEVEIQASIALQLGVTSADLIQYQPAGAGAVATTVQAKLRITAADAEARELESSQPCYAAVAVNITRTTIDRHAFEDWSQLNTTDTGYGYCSFDAKAKLINGLNQNHFVGFQSRGTYAGSGNLTNYFRGYDVALRHEGTGTVANATGLHILDVSGAGPITQNRGIYIATMARGSGANHAIYSDAGNAHMLGGPTGSVYTGVIQGSALNFGVDTVNKSIAIGYGTAGTTEYGTVKIYNGKTSPVVTVDYTGVLVAGGLNCTGTLTAAAALVCGTTAKTGAYTLAGLPVGTEGQITYCSNGRKVGQGAGAGTGVPVYWSNGAWRVFSTDAVVTA